MARIYNNTDEHGSDAEYSIFITNKDNSDARVAVLRLSTGNTQTWRTHARTFIISEHNSNAQICKL